MTPATPAPALPAAVAVSAAAAAAGIFRYCSGWPVSVFGGPESSVLAWTAGGTERVCQDSVCALAYTCIHAGSSGTTVQGLNKYLTEFCFLINCNFRSLCLM